MINDAAERGSQLTQHLLAFARRQPLQPQATDVNELIVASAQLLRPTLGEDIEIEAILDDHVAAAMIDAAQPSPLCSISRSTLATQSVTRRQTHGREHHT